MNDLAPRQFLFLVSSARDEGNTEWLAREAARHLSEGCAQRWIHLNDIGLPRFQDLRHGTGYGPLTGVERELFEATLAATDIVMVAPLYWYTLPASAKLYLDYWSAWLRAKEADFRAGMAGKRLAAVTVFSDADEKFVAPLTETLRYSAEYLKMHWVGTLIGNGSRPGDVQKDTAAIARARDFLLG